MDHIPVGEIASQLPMFIDPTMIVDNVLAGHWDAADALGNSPYVGDPEGQWERKRDGAAHGRLHRGRPPQPRHPLLSACIELPTSPTTPVQRKGRTHVASDGVLTVRARSSAFMRRAWRCPSSTDESAASAES